MDCHFPILGLPDCRRGKPPYVLAHYLRFLTCWTDYVRLYGEKSVGIVLGWNQIEHWKEVDTMFCRLLQMLGIISATPSDSLPPRNPCSEVRVVVVTDGNLLHKHQFERVPWNRERFGPDVTDFGPEPGTTDTPLMATYKDLFRCSCGAELIRSTRALV